MLNLEHLTEEFEEKLSRSLYHQEIEFLKWIYIELNKTFHNRDKKLHS